MPFYHLNAEADEESLFSKVLTFFNVFFTEVILVLI